MSDKPSRGHTFTCYSVDQTLDFSNLPNVDYAVWQLEQCPRTGRQHFQGYIHLKSPRRRAYILGLQNRMLQGSHIEPAGGDAASNTTYCTKEESRLSGPWTFGEMPKERGNPVAKAKMQEFAEEVMEVCYSTDLLEVFLNQLCTNEGDQLANCKSGKN